MTTEPGGFEALGLSEALLKALDQMGWSAPTEVQSRMIPVALAGHDILGQARTGTGKTAAFALPILQQLTDTPGTQALILAPTRELAAQVAGEIHHFSRFIEHRIEAVYGGTALGPQIQRVRKGPAVVVGTPGRVQDLIQRKVLKLGTVRFAVLDEVDRMFDIGFRDEVRRILQSARNRQQTIFVSATIEDEINRLARQCMRDPVEVYCSTDKLTVDEVDQWYLRVQPHDKRRMLVHLLKNEQMGLTLVFTRTKRTATRVAQGLKDAGINAQEIHGDLYQSKREKIMKRFRDGKLNVLVATDLASRGIDVDDISHVINYDIPEDPEVYVHRIGRTARMGNRGKAYTFYAPGQNAELTGIEILINHQLDLMEPEGFVPSPPREEAKPASATPAPGARKGRPLGPRRTIPRRKR